MSRRLSQEARLSALELQRPVAPAEKPCPGCGSWPIRAGIAAAEDRAAITARIVAKLERLAPHVVRGGTPLTADDIMPRCATCGRRRARGVTR